MLNPKVILDALLLIWRDIPALVTAIGEDDSKISIYVGSYPSAMDITQTVIELGHPAILLSYQGTVQGVRGGTNVWEHRFSAFIGLPEEDPVSAAGIFPIWDAIANGKAEGGGGFEWWHEWIVNGGMPLLPPSIFPRFDFAGSDHRIDYWEVQFGVQEFGENP